MRNYLICTIVIVLFLFSSLAIGVTLVVGKDGWQPYLTIQDAINDAIDGDVIKVNQGIYPEQIVIRNLKYLMIQGDQATISVPYSKMTGSIVKIVNCEDIHITGFTIDGRNGVNVAYGARNSGGDTDTRFYGIYFLNSSGHIVNNTIKDVSWGNGVQQGNGIVVNITDGVEREINIQENIVTNFQKNGITFFGPAKAKIHKNTVTGWGYTSIIAQNCIQLGYDSTMTASVTSNVISKSMWSNPSTWASTGILLLMGNDNVRIVRNTISDSMIGIYVYPGSTNCKIINNSGSGNSWNYYSYEDDTKVHADKFADDLYSE